MIRISILVVFAMGCLALVAPAFATTYATVQVHELGTNPGLTSYGHFGALGDLGGQAAYVGVYDLDVQGATPFPLMQTNLGVVSFCCEMQYSDPSWGFDSYNLVDLDEAPLTGGNGTNPDGSMGTDRAQLLNNLFAIHFNNSVLTDNYQAAVFQASVWDIVYNGDVYLTPLGDGTLNQAASKWVADATAYTGPAFGKKLYALTNPTKQDYVVISNAVPEPMSIILGIMGLSSVAGFRRLRRK